mmetsp:Transcript_41920/g.70850  ORF Transcript_41920/g.70850 Transcript_41920/m.70850 type:complete len:280 (+) Transcript_41920:345-1184(+)
MWHCHLGRAKSMGIRGLQTHASGISGTAGAAARCTHSPGASSTRPPSSRWTHIVKWCLGIVDSKRPVAARDKLVAVSHRRVTPPMIPQRSSMFHPGDCFMTLGGDISSVAFTINLLQFKPEHLHTAELRSQTKEAKKCTKNLSLFHPKQLLLLINGVRDDGRRARTMQHYPQWRAQIAQGKSGQTGSRLRNDSETVRQHVPFGARVAGRGAARLRREGRCRAWGGGVRDTGPRPPCISQALPAHRRPPAFRRTLPNLPAQYTRHSAGLPATHNRGSPIG